MGHLTEEQLEDILQGRTTIPEHVPQCPRCRARLNERRILADRVHKAFSSIHADAGLVGRIRAQIAAARQPAAPAQAGPRTITLHARRHVWSGLAIAAAILVIVILRSSPINPGPQSVAARTALVGIHRANLDSLEGLMHDEGRHKPCECLRSKSSRGTAMPCCKRGLCLCGCQVREFQGRLVECCVIQRPNAPAVSVVVVPESPEALGMTLVATKTVTGQAVWQASCGSCNMASVRLGEESCCVIGQVPPEDLIGVLNALAE
jgi:hypothetical protein